PLVVDEAVTDGQGNFVLPRIPNVPLALVVRVDPPAGAPAETPARRTSPFHALPGDPDLRLVVDVSVRGVGMSWMIANEGGTCLCCYSQYNTAGGVSCRSQERLRSPKIRAR